jgi:hypothetical protein
MEGPASTSCVKKKTSATPLHGIIRPLDPETLATGGRAGGFHPSYDSEFAEFVAADGWALAPSMRGRLGPQELITQGVRAAEHAAPAEAGCGYADDLSRGRVAATSFRKPPGGCQILGGRFSVACAANGASICMLRPLAALFMNRPSRGLGRDR